MSISNLRRLTQALAVLTIVGNGAGVSRADDTLIPEIEVQARPWTDIGEGGGHATSTYSVIEPGDLPGVTVTAEELLAGLPGLELTTFGSPGHSTTVSVRGAEASHTRVMLDGIPWIDPNAGPFNLAELPVGLIDRLEIYRGRPPLRLGGGGIGGVLNIVTRRPRTGEIGGTLAGGSFSTARLGARAAHVAGSWEGLLALEGFSSEGDYEYLNDNATPFNPADDRRQTRNNNDVEYVSALARARYRPASGTWLLEALGEFYLRHRGLAGTDSTTSEFARLDTRHALGTLSARVFDPAPWLTELDLRVSLRAQRSHLRDTEGEIGVGRQNLYQDFLQATTVAYGETPRTALGRLALRLAGTGSRFAHDNRLSDTAEQDHRRTQFDAGIEHTATFLRRLHSVVSLYWMQADSRYDPVDARQGLVFPERHAIDRFVSPHIGLRVDLTDELWVTANAGRYSRLPGFVELFGDSGGVQGNPDLEPEESQNLDLGLGFCIGQPGTGWSLHGGAAVFRTRIEQLIVYVQNSQRTSRPQNIGKADIVGVETDVQAAWGHALQIAVGHTYLETEDRGDVAYWAGNRLPHRPRHALSVSTRLGLGDWGLVHRFRWRTARTLDRAEVIKTPTSRQHDLALEWSGWGAALEVRAEARNIGDEERYDSLGYPLPGRSYWLQLAWRWAAGG